MRSGRIASRKVAPETRRCAIYTRKSTSVGLEQDFNSLDAQREACTAYIGKQPAWTVVGERYDDGGFTGANIERPAFQRLLTDIEAGKIDVVIVYKVDRLSRSLLDFAKLMERFGRAKASFVSVTQNFSTADAMGRLTLNMLMSFAEFEREMIGERTRDKIAAARRKGKWTGGTVPLGYSVEGKRLAVNDLEAVLVREIFALYLEQRSALAVARLLNERHRLTKHHRAENGKIREARPWTKADVLSAIKNPVYAGYMRSHGEFYEGEHEALVDRETFSRARALLDGATRTTNDPARNPNYILRGLLRCACCGSPFTPASTRRGRTEYRYYRCIRRDKEGREACPSSPLPAGAIEAYVIERLREFAAGGPFADAVEIETSWVARCLADFGAIWDVLTPENQGRLLRAVVQSVEIDEPGQGVHREPRRRARRTSRRRTPRGARVITRGTTVVNGELHRVRYGRQKRFVAIPSPGPVHRPARVAITLASAHKIRQAILIGEIKDQAEAARKLGLTRARLSQILDLTKLAPDLQEEILFLEAIDGREPLSERALRGVVSTCSPKMIHSGCESSG
jgi:DNA invertase Pin-like site-specific DNA recombinase